MALHGRTYAGAARRVQFRDRQYADEEGRSPFPVNPVKVLSETRAWARVDRRRTLIQTHDLCTWYEAVTGLTNAAARDYLITLILTGLRRGEAGSLL